MKTALQYIISSLIAAMLLSTSLQAKNNHIVKNDIIKKEQQSINVPFSFIENKGQIVDQNHDARTDIQFSIQAAPGLNVFIGDGAIHYQFCKTSAQQQQNVINGSNSVTADMYRMDVVLEGANRDARVVTEDKQDYYEHYCSLGAGQAGMAYAYRKITYKDIYPNIDWVLYVNNGQLKHEFVVKQGGRVSDIKLKYGGHTDLKINVNGSITAVTPQGTINEQAPKSYQADGKEVSSSFALNGNVITFNIAAYSGTLTIDPTLVWGTYYGGNNTTIINGIATDLVGHVYIAGATKSTTHIATSGAYHVAIAGGYDACIASFSASGAIQWSTYYGGTNDDEAYGIATDIAGNIYITGAARSSTGIATPGSFQPAIAGSGNAFLAKFASAGTLIWATYYGGNALSTVYQTLGNGIAIDSLCNVYITGRTNAISGITTTGAYQTAQADDAGGGVGSVPSHNDGFLAKFDSSGARKWATYYGGPGEDAGTSLAIDDSGNVFMEGYTAATSGIATPGAYQTTQGDGGAAYDAFLVKFDSTGARRWATYFGGNGYDVGGFNYNAQGVAVDSSGNVYIAGTTNSISGIATVGAHQVSIGGGSYDGFIAKLNAAGNMQWATYYGGAGSEQLYGLSVTRSGNVYVTGRVYSVASPTMITTGAFKTNFENNDDIFFSKFSTAGAIVWGSYYGDGLGEEGMRIIANDAGLLYFAGTSQGTTEVATAGAYQTTNYCSPSLGENDAFLVRFNDCTAPTGGTITGATTVCTGGNIVLSDATAGGAWSTSNTNATVTGGVVTGITTGTVVISYQITNLCGTATAVHTVTVQTLPTAGSITGTTTFCEGATTTLTDGTSSIAGVWTSSNTGIATVSASGVVYGVTSGTPDISYTVTNGCGSASTYSTITINPLPSAGSITGTTALCTGSSTTLSDGTASGAGTWSSSNSGVATIDNAGVVYGTTSGTTNISYAVTNGCGTATVHVAITVSSLPSAGTITGPGTACVGATSMLSDGVGGGIWTSSNTNIATVDASGGVGGVTVGSATITYVVTSSCGTATTTAGVTVGTLPAAGVITGTDSVCVGDTVTLLAAPGGGAWSCSNTTITKVLSGAVIGLMPGIDTIKYTITNSCGSAVAVLPFKVGLFAGCTTGSAVLGNKNTVSVYPNPNDGSFTMNVSSPVDEEMQIVIVNVAGQKVTTITGRTNIPNNIKIQAPAGIYMLSATSEHIRYRTKIILE